MPKTAHEYHLAVVDGRAHVYASTAHNAEQEAERCRKSLSAMTRHMDASVAYETQPNYAKKLRDCFLADEEALATRVLADHYAERHTTLQSEGFTEI